MESKLITAVNTISLLLLMYSVHSVQGQSNGCSTITETVVNITDGDPGGRVVYELINISNIVTSNFQNSEVLSEYFDASLDRGRIETIRSVDRDDIASRIIGRRSYDHVQFLFDFVSLLYPIIDCYYVTLNINDLNNDHPTFTAGSVLVEIAEESEKSIPLEKAMDRDEGINSTINYSLVDDLNGLFRLDVRNDSSGFITQVLLENSVPLDRENVSQYYLRLKASEGSENPRSAFLDLNVTVTDICDVTPSFITSRYFPEPVPENSTTGTVIFNNITAYDADLVDSDGLLYEINEVCRREMIDSSTCETVANGQHPFLLDMENGLLTLDGELDREEYARYEVSIHATDQCMRSATATVVVLVEDVNDNCPQIDYTPSNVNNEVSETLRFFPNTVGFFVTSDRDSGNNSLLQVELFEEVDGLLSPSDIFTLNNNIGVDVWQLEVNQAVDREVQSSYSLVVRATDFGTPSCFSRYNLTVIVTDSNDNPPIFQPILPLFEVREDTQENYMVVSLLATDEDDEGSGSGLITYYLPESNETFPYQHLFKIENVTGLLKLATSLDREELANISVLVEARDNPQFNLDLNSPVLRDSIVVNIYVVDVNDNAPIIHYPVGSIEVREDYVPNTVLFSINATDLDTPPHSTLTYQISTNGPFSVNEDNGMVFLNNNGLNFEMSTQYDVSIHVTDREFTTMLDISIVVLNVNDERPQFIRQPPIYSGNVQEENQISGQVVATIEVVDLDNPPESLTFQIESGNERGHFTIDPISGQLTTTTSLDKEDIANYTLIVSITDGTFFAERNAVIYIMVLDINDNPPTFVGQPYNFRVMEGHPAGTIVRGPSEDDVVRAIDLDSTINGVITYAILGANPAVAESWFSIDEDEGQITTKVVLDREDRLLGEDGVVRLSVGATNPTSGMGHTDDIEVVNITVLDINDQRPNFETSEVVIDLSENHETGSPFLTVHAIDNDQPPNNEIDYIILNSPPGILDMFFIHPTTGELSLLQSLDHETQDQIQLEVRARDASIHTWDDIQTININVIDAPDPCLRLINFVPFVNLQENAPIMTPVVTFEATNLQGESVSTVTYTLRNIDGSASLAFDISEDQDFQATVHTAMRDIDRESLISQGSNQATYRLNITAHDTVSSLECVTISSVLTVTILDENDNSPVFSSELYELTILENTPGESLVGSVSATDSDLGENSTVTYSILQTNNLIPFTINNEGQISSTQELDHDSPSGSLYEFTVVAQDGGSVPLTSITTVRVEVLDLNDNSPEFDRNQNHTFLISEDSAIHITVATILVSDADSGGFGEVIVSILPGRRLDEHFQLQQNGSIRLVQELDRELEDMYSFEVRATDGGGRTAMATIQIVVGDVNDNAPIFNLEPISTITIPENHQTGIDFTNVSARDADIGLNGEVYYVLADESLSMIFNVHRMTGQISLGSSSCLRPSDNRQITSIDYERQSSYIVTVLAYDQSFPRHFARKTINVAVTNVNEYAPEFDRSMVVVSVDEGQNVGTEVIRIKAYDWDYDSLTYSILENNESSIHFRYREDGSIVTTTVLDYNVKILYFLTLTAQELGTDEHKIGSIFVEVLVNNINNHQPVFNTMDYSTSTEISESTALETIVLTVHATDPDNATHDAVSYEILSGNENNVFSIDSLTGDISVSSLLDYDNITSYVLTVVAKDTGDPQRTSTSLELTIALQNINDESPIFTAGSYEFGLTENNQLNAVVGQVEASDRDGEPFNSVKYFLPSGAGGYFDIDENSGDIFSLVEVDREGDIASVFPVMFTVVATDNGSPPRTASAQVSVNIVDANDNPPVFSRRLYYQSIIQSQAPASPIINLASEVVDRDQGQNAEIQFEIRSQPQGNLFELSSSGQILLKEFLPLDPQLLYEITVRASDQLDPNMYAEAIVRIIVESEGGHHPIFDALNGYLIEVREDVSIPSSIFRTSEHVTDSDSNSQLSFQFKQTYPKFSIEASTGIITVIEALNFEEVKMYTLAVEVIDNTQRTTETSLTVSVTDVNDNSPIFDNIPSTLVLSRVPDANINLFTVQANDLDEGLYGHVEYSVSENGGVSVYFNIDPVTGTVKSKGDLSVGQTFFLNVTAFDGGIDPLQSTTATITITIHNPPAQSVPTFQGISSSHIIDVNEDRERGTLFQLTTLPSAEGYAIVNSDAPSELFRIASSQGSLILQGDLSRRDYELVIEAFIEDTEDLRNIVRYSSYLQIQVHVLDVNNNFPQFSSIDSASISEDADIGSSVTTVNAFDEDIGVNGMLNYEINEGNFERVFTINGTSGEITLSGNLDREQYSSYDLVIRAFDLNVINPKFMEMTLHIEVLDVNDYSPRFIKDGNYSLDIYEYPHTMNGERIVRLAAIDRDVGPPLRYDLFLIETRFRGSLVSDPSLVAVDTFQINRDSGIISLRSHVQLDYEAVDYYLLRVQASDTQTMATTYLEFNILDVNDHSPEITCAETTVEIWEQQPIGSIITKGISSSDIDHRLNNLVTYSLGEEWTQAGDTFMIDPHTGVIRVKNPIVFSSSIFQLSGTIYALDNGIPRRSASKTMTVYIFDVNDNSPVFGQQDYVFPISINAPGGSPIGTVVAQDTVDYRENTAITMSIPHYYNEARRFFNFASNGSLSLIPVQGLKPRDYTFRIQAFSPSFCPDCPQYNKIAYTDVTVAVYPPCPEFLSTDHTIDVLEAQSSQDALLALSAVSLVGRPVEYFIDNSTEQPFIIDKYSGQVSLASILDRESVASYQFFVTAIDSVFQPSTCSAQVTVNVLDINDNSPVFQQALYNVSIQENSAASVTITTVTASDQDTGSNGAVEYEIAAFPDIPFTIERQTGIIAAKLSFDAEDIAMYEFQIKAVDNGPQRHEGFASVIVTVTDVNEFAPTFPNKVYSFLDISPDRFSKGSFVGTVRANDLDQSSQLTYSFLNEAPKMYFDIDSQTGDIHLTVSQNPGSVTVSKRDIRKRQIDNTSTTPSFFSVNAIVQATDGYYNTTTEVNFSLHVSFMLATQAQLEFTIIMIVAASVVGIIVAFFLLLSIAVFCRWKRTSRKMQVSPPNNTMELGTRFSSKRSQESRSNTPSQYRQTSINKPFNSDRPITTLHHSSGSGSNSSRQSYANYADDEMDSNNGDNHTRTAYHSQGLTKKLSHPSPPNRSTSDLASSIGTDMLGSQQLPHPKARIAAIYAAHHGLLNNHGSQESIHSNHTFASEGGREADAEADIENMLYSKYEFEDDDDDDDNITIPDDSSYIGKEHQSMHMSDSGNLNVPPVEEDLQTYSHSQAVPDWVPRATPMEHTIDELNELASYPSTVSQEDHPAPRSSHYTGPYDHSQQMSMYGASSQGSRISLLRHHNGGHPQPRHFDAPSKVSQPLLNEYDYFSTPRHDPRYNQYFQGKQRYGSANILPTPREYGSPRDIGGQRMHTRGIQHSLGLSQDAPPTYHQNPYLQHGVNSRTPSDTPTDGTVTPRRAIGADYDHTGYLSSSSTSIGSTNLSGTISSIGQSASQRMYPK